MKNDIIISNFNLDDPLESDCILQRKDFETSENFLKRTQIKNQMKSGNLNEIDNYLTNHYDKINIDNLSYCN